jgi:hypothetical protein
LQATPDLLVVIGKWSEGADSIYETNDCEQDDVIGSVLSAWSHPWLSKIRHPLGPQVSVLNDDRSRTKQQGPAADNFLHRFNTRNSAQLTLMSTRRGHNDFFDARILLKRRGGRDIRQVTRPIGGKKTASQTRRCSASGWQR